MSGYATAARRDGGSAAGQNCGSGGKPIIESQAPRHDGKKTAGGTLKNLARATMWLLVISRSPFRIAESVDCEIPTAFEWIARPMGRPQGAPRLMSGS